MAPRFKFIKDEIINTAVEIVRKNGAGRLVHVA